MSLIVPYSLVSGSHGSSRLHLEVDGLEIDECGGKSLEEVLKEVRSSEGCSLLEHSLRKRLVLKYGLEIPSTD